MSKVIEVETLVYTPSERKKTIGTRDIIVPYSIFSRAHIVSSFSVTVSSIGITDIKAKIHESWLTSKVNGLLKHIFLFRK